MFVKVCGLRSAADVAAAVSAGADAVGFVFAESVRRVEVAEAKALASGVPSEVLTVGVFSGIPAGRAGEMALTAGLGAIQLHGDYPREAFAELADLPVRLIRATTLKESTDVRAGGWGEDMLLLDSPVAGSGQRWNLASLDGARPSGKWMLAGGLRADNVADAVRAARPWGVDVSSGVEVTRGAKDPGLIRDFVTTVRQLAAAG
ncbi:phosphoribosylanthranilate isomerase [Actinokineospora iranica]|uniref:N-(5'-phosphoribosyl)anthranilate isomerase n=1 Tax=Actinokineospora iranica TaxID=1271860 RepID=A0A1G6N0X4_9PSEU|nr:phosphoribosylanthranilate isomerase [Actinokineospora iranica]SDC61351.1 phosphoribosylanthranilate isomerase [Actinokineospora iranica]